MLLAVKRSLAPLARASHCKEVLFKINRTFILPICFLGIIDKN